jgi:asparagine synthase (glutamine-hydrolysing)
VVAPGERVDRAALERMGDALSHRGPDDRGIEVRDQVGLVHTRLAIVDPTPAGHQPMADPAGRWLLTYNGEIFNHSELREQLPRIAYRGHSDTETLVHALATWGEGAIPRCNGQFAFGAADLRARRLLLVRDHFGIKPLYIARHDGAVWFASEIKALLAAGIPRRPSSAGLAPDPSYFWTAGTTTPIAGIELLAQGTAVELSFDTLNAHERRWYDPADAVDAERAADLAGRSRSELTAMLEEALRLAVGQQLMADVPLGTMCSGGLDSSLVTALAQDESPGIAAFTGSTPGDPADETRWAELVARALGVPLRKVEITPSAWRAALVPAVAHHEYPLLNESAVPIAGIAALAHRERTKVVLTGEGADELFGGYGLHRDLYRRFLPRRLQMRRNLDLLLGFGLGRVPRSAVRRMRRITRGSAGRLPGQGPSEEALAVNRAVLSRASRAYSHHPGPRGELEASLLAGLGRPSPLPFLLNRMDKNALQHSVEARVPFLDPDLVALVLNLPLEARAGPRPKGILRDVAEHHLPRRIALRAKRGGLSRDARSLIGAAARPEFIDDGHLRGVIDAPLPPWRDMLRSLTSREMISVCSAEICCRLFLDGSSVARVEAELWDPARV